MLSEQFSAGEYDSHIAQEELPYVKVLRTPGQTDKYRSGEI
jgi:hypothetical protein